MSASAKWCLKGVLQHSLLSLLFIFIFVYLTDAAKDIFRRCNMTVAMKGNKKRINTDAIEKILELLD